jgi:hypothetical protein
MKTPDLVLHQMLHEVFLCEFRCMISTSAVKDTEERGKASGVEARTHYHAILCIHVTPVYCYIILLCIGIIYANNDDDE